MEYDNLYLDMNGIIHPCFHPEDRAQIGTRVVKSSSSIQLQSLTMGKKGTIGFDKLPRFNERRIKLEQANAIESENTIKDDGDLESDFEPIDDESLLQEQVKEIPFEVLQKARSEGHNFVPYQKPQFELKRANKNRPMEISSKKPVGRFREVIQARKLEHRDPRFESLCGNFDEDRFAKAYSFLFNEELPAEYKRLQKLSKTQKNHADAEKTQEHLKWIDRQLKSEEARRRHMVKISEQKKTEKEAVKQGKRPYYVKKSEMRRQELIEKYNQLKASGKLETYMTKRRKKNAAKDHRYVPYRRTAD